MERTKQIRTLLKALKHRRFRQVLVIGTAATIVALVLRGLLGNFQLLEREDYHLNPGLAVASALPLGLGILLLAAGWIILLRSVTAGRSAPLRALLTAYIYAWAGRYVPGKLPFFLGKVYLGRVLAHGLGPLTAATGVETILQPLVMTALGASLVAGSLGLRAGNGWYVGLAVVPAFAVLALHPKILTGLTNRVMGVLGRERLPPNVFPPFSAILAASAAYAVAATLNGFGFHLLVLSIVDAGWRDLALSIGAFCLAAVLGMLVVVAPAGLGARDGSLAGLMATTLTVEAATVAALAARIWSALVDVALVGGAAAYDYVSGQRLLGRVLAGEVAQDVERSELPEDAATEVGDTPIAAAQERRR